MKVGRPPNYKTKEDMQAVIDIYFDNLRRLPNKAGLLLALDMTRSSWSDYKKKEEFSYTIRRCNKRIENAWIGRLEEKSPVGAIFYLKNAFKEIYKDKHDIEHSGNITIVTTKYEGKDSS